MADAPTFGERVRELRKAKGMNQRALGAAIGLDFTYLSKIETGSLPPPSDAAIQRFAETLGANFEELLGLTRKVPADLSRTLAAAPIEATILVRRLKTLSSEQLRKMLAIAK